VYLSSARWSGSVTLGYLATTGNTEGSSLNSGAEINYALELWEHQATAAAVFTTEDKITTAEAYDAGWKSARNLTEHNYMYGRLNWRKDRFGSILEQFSQTIGYGRRLIDKEKHQLNGELGFGARQSKLSDDTNENDGIYTGRLTYTWQISETASFGQSFLVESGDSNTFTESVTNLRGHGYWGTWRWWPRTRSGRTATWCKVILRRTHALPCRWNTRSSAISAI